MTASSDAQQRAQSRAVVLAAQPRAMRTIDRLLAEGRAHAFMLVGDPGSGPRAAAVHIAEAVLCPAGGGDSCDTCLRVERGVHPDLTWVVPEGQALRIDQMRAVISTVSRTPFEADAQVVVIEAAGTLDATNDSAGNSLLKVLEEPAGKVVFVLLVESATRILPTLRSRAIEVGMPAVADELLCEAVERAGIDDAALARAGLDRALLARVARGSLERALSVAAGGRDAQRRTAVLARAAELCAARERPADLSATVMGRATGVSESTAAAATAELETAMEMMDPREVKSFKAKSNTEGFEARIKRRARDSRVRELAACLDELTWWYRDLLAMRAGAADSVVNADRAAVLGALAPSPAARHALVAIDAIEDARVRLVVNNADEPVVIAALCAELGGLAEGRVRSRRALGPTASTSAGYDLSLA